MNDKLILPDGSEIPLPEEPEEIKLEKLKKRIAEDTPIPEDSKGNPLCKFEVKIQKKPDGTVEKAIFINEELLDWSADLSSLKEAYQMGPKFFYAAQKDIEKHFINSVSEVLGRHVTQEDIKNATKTGWV